MSKLIQLNITLTESSREINKEKAKRNVGAQIANEDIKTKEPEVNCTIILCDLKKCNLSWKKLNLYHGNQFLLKMYYMLGLCKVLWTEQWIK